MNSLDKLKYQGLHEDGQELKLHLGCGETYLDGYINLDFPVSKHKVGRPVVDAYADIVKLHFPDGSVDEIRLHHVFEYFDRMTALSLLVKWHRWLKVDGILWIETPDVMESARQLVDEKTDYEKRMAIIRHLEGDQAATWGLHIGQWWPERFEHTLSKLGFHIISMEGVKWGRWPNLASVTVKATKLKDIKLETQVERCFDLLKGSLASIREQKLYKVWCRQLKEKLKGVKK